MTEKEKLLFEYPVEVKSALRGIRTFCVNHGLRNCGLKQTDAIKFYCKSKGINSPEPEDEIGFVLELYFSGNCDYVRSNSNVKRIKRKRSKAEKIAYKKPVVRMSKLEFYNSKAWLKMRVRVISAYGRKCMKCGCTNKMIQVDHIKPRSLFPKLELKFDNLQVLCIDCNVEKSNVDFTDYRAKVSC